MKHTTAFLILFSSFCMPAYAQDDPRGIKLSVETRVTNYLQNGYEGQFFLVLPNSRWSVGLGVGGQDVEGSARDLLFDGTELDALDIRLTWFVSGAVRYHFTGSLEGFYAELSAGAEEFRVKGNNQTQFIYNGFIVPLIGYRWFPWGSDGFFVNPKLGGIFTFARESERAIEESTYELQPFFPSPGLSLGWQF
ncbi:MAG: hypothetical protein MJA30_36865 [Cytophagales bacterium]|nr:hypothetical protein [Cytophagales bacterium]